MTTTAKARYNILKARREPFLRRARHLAAMTIPSLLPPEGHTYTSDLPQPYSGLAARCVVSLAARIMTAQLPPGHSPMRLTVPAELLAKEGATTVPPDLERQLALSEKTITSEIERRAWRSATNLGLLHLIVTGNVLERMLQDNTIRSYRLDQYVVCRTPAGQWKELIIEEALDANSLPDNLKGIAGARAESESKAILHLYTWVRKVGNKYETHQEFLDKEVPGSRGTYTVSPWFPLRWSAVIGEDYGRAKCEEHAADIMSVEGLTKSILEGSAMASRHVQMIRPNAAGGLNLRRRLSGAKNGDWVIGNPEDVGMLKFENFPQMQFVSQELESLKTDLKAAFLLDSAAVRQAERVTAEEIRTVTQELEGALGGTYSMLAQEMMLQRLDRLIFQMQRNRQLPDWPDGSIEPVILTGLEALGRASDVEKVASALQLMQGVPEEIIRDYPKWNVLLNKAFVGLQIPDAVNSDAEVKANQEQRAMIEAMTASAPRVAPQIAEAAAAQAQPQQ
jgi:hypothetical protein